EPMLKTRVLVVAAALTLTLSACGDGSESGNQAEGPLPAGERLVLVSAPITDMKTVSGEITTRDRADARARIPGTLISLDVREGDHVDKGQRLAMIADERISFEAKAYAAQAAAAEAQAAQAREELRRVQDLFDNKVYAQARLDQAVAAAKAADAQLAAARAQRSASASMVEQGAVLAPDDGRVLRADIPPGSAVAPGMPIVVVTAGSPILKLELPESLAGQVRAGARVTLTGDEVPMALRSGEVVQVYPAIENGRVRIDAALPDLKAEMVGRRVTAQIEIGQRDALTIPRRFISTRYGIDFVDVVVDGRRVSTVPVQFAPTADPEVVEILSGVVAGDTVIAVDARP
ncbi:MAG: efflux RND transporter periplasmic adaptor subunit, partial [Rhodobacteraceae bacterium]|nr:efflux RND transporter periplasmic adaptor subunit [Paracoccaceae bacterium]